MSTIEHVLYAQTKLNHININLESHIPIIRYIEDNNIDLDVKLAVHKDYWKTAMNLGVPENRLITPTMLGNSTVKYCYSDYGPGYPHNIENWYKTQYGHGDESQIYNQTIFWRMKNFKGWILYSPYDCYKLAHKMLHKGKRLFWAGSTRFSEYNLDDFRFKELILSNPKFDKSKPTIVLNHTWNKLRHEDAGYLDYRESKSIEYLRSISSKYNIISKIHHQDRLTDIPEEFIPVVAGSVYNHLLYSLADIIISDYGGSALDSLYYNKPVIYLDGFEVNSITSSQNTDILVHRNLLSATDEDFEYVFNNLERFHQSVVVNSDRLNWKNLLYPETHGAERRWVDIMLSLSNGSKSEYEYTDDSELETDINFLDRAGLIGPPPPKLKDRLDTYLSLPDNLIDEEHKKEVLRSRGEL